MRIKPTFIVGIMLLILGIRNEIPSFCTTLTGQIIIDVERQERGYIGIRYGSTIEQVFINSPADHAGLLPHDKIIAINGDYHWTNQDDIDGQPGTYVYLTIQRMVNYGFYSLKVELVIPVLRLPHNQIDWKHNK